MEAAATQARASTSPGTIWVRRNSAGRSDMANRFGKRKSPVLAKATEPGFPDSRMRLPRLAGREKVAEFLSFGLQVFLGVLAGSNFAGNAFHNLYAGVFQGVHFVGIIGEQADARDAQRFENFAGKGEVPVVGFEAEAFIGFHGVQALVLQFIR